MPSGANNTESPQFLQIIGDDAIAAYRRMELVLRAAEKALSEARKSGIRPTITVAEAARQLGMDYKTFCQHDWAVIDDPDCPRIKLVYVDEIRAWQEAHQTTMSALHAAKRTRQHHAKPVQP